MSLPEIQGYKILKHLGEGSTSTSYSAINNSNGEKCIIKIFEPLSINKEYLNELYSKISQLDKTEGLLEVIEFNFTKPPLFLIIKNVKKITIGDNVTKNFDFLCGKIKEEEAWELIREILITMSLFHRKGISHGSIKPSNILLDADAPLKPKITNFGIGWIGNIYHIGLTDIFYYCCPDQIQNPSKIFNGAGFSWDVYAFGVISYKLITGTFPRGQNKFILNDNNPNNTINLEDVVNTLRSSPKVYWPEKAKNPILNELREIINECLNLEEKKRFSDLREVEAAFSVILYKEKNRKEQRKSQEILKSNNLKLQKAKITIFSMIIMLVIMGYFSFENYLEKKEISFKLFNTLDKTEKVKKTYMNKIARYKEMSEKELQEKINSSKNKEETLKNMLLLSESRNKKYYYKMQNSYEMTAKLFDSITKLKRPTDVGFKNFPKLANELEKYYSEFIETNHINDTLDPSVAKAYYFLGKLSLLKNDKILAGERINTALNIWNDLSKTDQNNYVYDYNIIECKYHLLKLKNKSKDKISLALELEDSISENINKIKAHSDKTAIVLINLKLIRKEIYKKSNQENSENKVTQLLESIISDPILKKYSNNEIINAKFADIYSELSEIYSLKGQEEKAQNFNNKATKILKVLLKNNPILSKQNLSLASHSAEINKLMTLAINSDTEKNKSLNAIKSIQNNIHQMPDNDKIRADLLLSRIYRNLSTIERAKAGSKSSLNFIEKSLDILKSRKEWQDLLLEYRIEKALSLCSLAMHKYDLKQTDNAFEISKEVEELLKTINSQDISFINKSLYRNYLYEVADFYSFYGHLMTNNKKPKLAKENYNKAKILFETASRDFNENKITKDVIIDLQKRLK